MPHRFSLYALLPLTLSLYLPAHQQNKRMNEYDGILATKIVQIYKHTFFKILLTG